MTWPDPHHDWVLGLRGDEGQQRHHVFRQRSCCILQRSHRTSTAEQWGINNKFMLVNCLFTNIYGFSVATGLMDAVKLYSWSRAVILYNDHRLHNKNSKFKIHMAEPKHQQNRTEETINKYNCWIICVIIKINKGKQTKLEPQNQNLETLIPRPVPNRTQIHLDQQDIDYQMTSLYCRILKHIFYISCVQ